MMDVGDYRALWGEVLIRAVQDAHGIGLSSSMNKNASDLATHQAKKWFGTRDFRMVCELAGFDPDFIMDAYCAGKLKNVLTDPRNVRRRMNERRPQMQVAE